MTKTRINSATRGAQVVPIEIPTNYICNLVPNRVKLLSNKKVSASHTFRQDHGLSDEAVLLLKKLFVRSKAMN